MGVAGNVEWGMVCGCHAHNHLGMPCLLVEAAQEGGQHVFVVYADTVVLGLGLLAQYLKFARQLAELLFSQGLATVLPRQVHAREKLAGVTALEEGKGDGGGQAMLTIAGTENSRVGVDTVMFSMVATVPLRTDW